MPQAVLPEIFLLFHGERISHKNLASAKPFTKKSPGNENDRPDKDA